MVADALNWEVLIRYHDMRDWRVIMARDNDGRLCEHLLLPMKRNGIVMTDDGKFPYARYRAYPVPLESNMRGFFRRISPIIPFRQHGELISEGLLTNEERYWSDSCGGIRMGNWARDEKIPFDENSRFQRRLMEIHDRQK